MKLNRMKNLLETLSSFINKISLEQNEKGNRKKQQKYFQMKIRFPHIGL